MLSVLVRSFGRFPNQVSRFALTQKLSKNYITMSKSAIVILSPGSEELETIACVDILRRAGVQVTVAGINDKNPVKCSRDVVIVPDVSLEEAKDTKFDAIVMPGGLGGSKAMCASKLVGELLKKQESEGRIIAAICAAPTALAAHDICAGKKVTSYPAMKNQLDTKYTYIDNETVVQDGTLITSRGPATAIDFGLKIAENLAGAEKAKEVAKGMLVPL